MVSTVPTVCESYAYSFSLSIDWVTRPEIVVMPTTAQQVLEIVKLANQYKVPITPKGVVGTTGHGGPLHGGILLDFIHMDKILSIYWPLEKIQQCTEVLEKATAMELFDVHINDKWKFEGFKILTGESLSRNRPGQA